MTEEGRHRLAGMFSVIVCMTMLTGLLIVAPESANAFPDNAWIMGNVSDGTDPVENAYVKAMLLMGNGAEINSTMTDADGNFLMMVPGGLSYLVFAAHGDYLMSMNSVTISPGETKSCDFILAPIPYPTDVTIYGYVKDESGTPRSDGLVLGMVNNPMGGDMPYYANITTPDIVTGYFEVNVIQGPMGGGAVGMDFPGYPMSQNDTDAWLESGKSYEFNITLRPQVFSDDAMVYGRITDIDSGLPLSSGVVSYELDSGMDRYSNWTLTDENGDFAMDVHSGDNLRLTFQKIGYTIKFYQIEVLPAEAVQQDAALRMADAKIRGYVTENGTGDPIVFCRVFLVDNVSMQENISMAMTDSSGYYELDAFSGTNLYFGAEQDGYARNFTVIDVNPGSELSYDFTLTPFSAWLVGQVTDIMSGAPLVGASVHINGPVEEHQWTNSTGEYNFSLLPGDYHVEVNHWMGGTGYKTYSDDITVLDGIENVLDVALVPWKNAILKGHVYDVITGDPVPFARVQASGVWYNSTETDGAGDYEMWLVDGSYTAYISADNYEYNMTDVVLPEMMETVLDVGLLPRNPETTALLHGYVNNSDDATPIKGAEVRIRLDGGQYENWTWTDVLGYYEMYVPPWILKVRSNASAHAPYFGQVDLTGISDYSLDIVLDRDAYEPNLTYSQSPLENISLTNPSIIDATIQEEHLRDMTLIQFMEWNSSSYGSNWTMIGWKRTSFDPWNPELGLPYSIVDGNYTVHQAWNASVSGGWLWNGTSQAYFPASFWPWYPDPAYALSGFYTNATAPRTSGAGLFNASTGELMAFMPFGMGSPIQAPDPTGVFEPQCFVIEYVGGFFAGAEWRSFGMWDVNGLMFTYDSVVPSGNYKTEFFVSDWGSQGNVSMRDVVVDNEPPMVEAGIDQLVNNGTSVTLDGSATDNGYIADYEWTFVDVAPIELDGATVSYTFSAPGQYLVTLTVTDAAGNWGNDTLLVIVNGPPVADAGDDEFIVAGDWAWFDGWGSYDDLDWNWMMEYTWTFVYGGSTVVLTGINAWYQFNTPGTYVVELKVRDTGGLEGNDSMVVDVVIIPSAWWVDPRTGDTLVDGARISLDYAVLRGYVDQYAEVSIITPTEEYHVFADEYGIFEQDRVNLSEGLNIVTVVTYSDWWGWVVSLFKMIQSDTHCLLWVDSPESPTSSLAVPVGGWTDADADVTVNGVPAAVMPDGTFGIDVALLEGPNVINVTAADSVGNMNWAEFVVVRDTTPPILFVTAPLNGAETSEPNVLVYGTVDSGAVVRVNGVLAEGGTDWSATVSLVEGWNTIVVTATDYVGNTVTTTLVVDYVPPVYVTPEELAAVRAELLGEINNLSVALQENVSALQDQIDAAMDEIAGLQTSLAENITALQGQIDSAMDEILALQASLAENITALQAQINAAMDEIAAFQASVAENVTALQDQIDVAVADIAGLQASLLENVTALQTQIVDAMADIVDLETGLANNVSLLQSQINAAVLDISDLQAALTENVTALQNDIATLEVDLQANITALQQAIAQNATALQQALTQNVTALQSQIAALRADLQANVTSLTARLAENVTALQGLVNVLDQDVADMQAEIAAMNATLVAAESQMETALDSMQADIDDLQQELNELNQTIQDQIDDVEQKTEDTDSFAGMLMYLTLILFAIAIVMVALVWYLSSKKLGKGGSGAASHALEEVEQPSEVEREFESLEKEIKREEL